MRELSYSLSLSRARALFLSSTSVGVTEVTGAAHVKNFLSWVSGKTPQAQLPVADYVPLGRLRVSLNV